MDRVAHASTVGAGHERNGEACADAVAVDHGPDGVLRFVVCDGAGSAAEGGRGAACVAERLLGHLRTFVTARPAPPPGAGSPADGAAADASSDAPAEAWRRLAKRAVFDLRHALRDLARARGVPVGQFATTVLFGVVDAAGGRFAQLGDGAIVVDAHGTCRVPTRAPESEHPNETVFVTSGFHAVRTELSTAVVPGPIDGLLVFTDGLERLMLRFPGREPTPELVRALVRDVARARSAEHASGRLLDLVRSSRVRARTDDDCTLVVAVRDVGLASWAPAPRPSGPVGDGDPAPTAHASEGSP